MENLLQFRWYQRIFGLRYLPGRVCYTPLYSIVQHIARHFSNWQIDTRGVTENQIYIVTSPYNASIPHTLISQYKFELLSGRSPLVFNQRCWKHCRVVKTIDAQLKSNCL